MQKTKMDQIVERMTEYICDSLCKNPEKYSEEELQEICAECEMGQFICDIPNEYNRYAQMVKCSECEFRKDDTDCAGTFYSYCRFEGGLEGDVTENDGCSRGRRRP